jgi:hypothetical protein
MKSAALMVLLFAAGCTSPQFNPFGSFNPDGVQRRMTDLVNQNKFQEAREVSVKAYPLGTMKKSPEELMKERLIETLVNPAEAKFTVARIQGMKAKVADHLAKGDDEAARRAVHEMGVTDQKAVNTVVYIAKCNCLNTSVNPRRWRNGNVTRSNTSADTSRRATTGKHWRSRAGFPRWPPIPSVSTNCWTRRGRTPSSNTPTKTGWTPSAC